MAERITTHETISNPGVAIEYGAKDDAVEARNGGVRHSGSLHPKPLGYVATPGFEMASQ